MIKVGAYEAKTHLSKLLNEVTKGERVIITKHGAPIAVLTPAVTKMKKSVAETVEEIQKLRKGRTLGKLKLKEIIEYGRR